ncbi:extracellular solute-binding protein [Polyangium jinanense]|uniref:Extracellular solute-binding protein n=1 Tax=Polyangium jinanense TaxID=2829994 RepID=A0A9X4ARK3_9BACT|nr:extracellular solute-binding protein [Polyangium jinanense]MDC3955230.1 extracellular solute-binding protein [Polyangium jinanense]MDC3981531.1 extracellular solute-binding protein [Polyangium jinanense]
MRRSWSVRLAAPFGRAPRSSGARLGRAFASLLSLLAIALSVLISPAARAEELPSPSPEGRVRVSYWEKWTGMEKEAMESVIDDFHRSQTRVWVDYQSVSQYQHKTLIATAGGDPPDIAGLLAADIADFAEKNALVPLDELMRGTHMSRESFLPVYWDMGVYRDHVWAVVSVPNVVSLYWNKDLFAKAGLDPDRPPRTIAELDAFAEKLTVVKGGKIEQLGFMPTDTNWWPYGWGFWFGARLWDGGANITIDSPENVRAFSWFQSYGKRHDPGQLQNFTSSFGNFASAQNPFLSGKLGMVLQGIWMGNFIQKFSPGMRWGAAAFPSEKEGGPPVAIADADMLVIPSGAKHPNEAFTFLKYLTQQGPMEKLCLGQRKLSPLRSVSPSFYREHQNPFIKSLQDLAASPGATPQPRISVWNEYTLEIRNASQRLWLGEATAEQALGDVKQVVQKSWDRHRHRQEAAPSRWLSVLPFLLIGLFGAGIVGAAWRERNRLAKMSGVEKPVRSNASLGKGLAFFSPWGIGLLVFLAYPVASSIVYSFCDYSVLSPPRWIGLQNFVDLFQDEVFWIALQNTLIYVAIALPLGLTVALFFALLLDAKLRGSSIYRTLIFLPTLVPVVAGATIWIWMLNGEYGVINHFLHQASFGLFPKTSWLAERRFALPSLILVSTWTVGQTVLTLLAAMQDVPRSIYEAADIDGASFWQKIRHVTIPMISPVIYFNAIMGIIGALQVFATPYIMTAGGPARATLFYTQRLHENAFYFLRMGYACAMAWILFLVVLGLTALAHRLGHTRVHYGGA